MSAPSTGLETAAWVLQRAAGEVEVPVAGFSMHPTLPVEALVRARRARAEDVVPGAVVLLEHAERLVVHRVAWKADDGAWIVTRGDSRWVPDPPVRASAVLGLVTAVRNAGRWEALPPAPRAWWSWAARLATGALAGLTRRSPAAAVRLAGFARALRGGGAGPRAGAR